MLAYRAHVDAAMARLLAHSLDTATCDLIELGLAHEEQHQELTWMDILNLFAASPLKPGYGPDAPRLRRGKRPAEWVDIAGGIVRIGAEGGRFAFDNETPRHDTLLGPYRLASALVTNGEWLAFMDDGGYRRPEFWLSDGWTRVQTEGWEAPLYWRRCSDSWSTC